MLAQSLNNFAVNMNHHFPLMNKGGCAVFAVHVAKRLQKLVPTRIKMFNYDNLDISVIRSSLTDPLDIQNWHDSGAYFVHLVVEFDVGGKTYQYDTDGVRPAAQYWKGYELCSGEFTIEEVTRFAADAGVWNSVFNRTQIPTVKRQIKNLFTRHIYHDQLYKY